jgi:orotidine-5'-phosphate decarboxylase
MRVVRTLGDACGFYKIGSELFTAEGPSVVRAVRDSGRDVFLDLNSTTSRRRSARRRGRRRGSACGS